MVAWIIYFREGAIYNRQYIQFYIEEGRKLGIEVKLILVEELEFGVRDNVWFLEYKKKEVIKPDFAICRAIYPLLNRQLENMGIRVFNSSFVSEICNDKARTYQYLAKTGIKMVDSSFYRNIQMKEVISKLVMPVVVKKVNSQVEQPIIVKEVNPQVVQPTVVKEVNARLEHPFVIKAVDGHGGSQVFLVEDFERQAEIIQGLGSSDVVVQPLTGSRHQDLRVYVIGKEIVAAVLRTGKDNFKSNFSLGGEVCIYHLNQEEIDLVNLIINQFDFGLVGIDFIIGDEGELIFNEIEDVVGSRMLYQTSDINIVERYLNYIRKIIKD
jgi:gamma-F420-2:alpha-L-glutamate ligase